MHLNGRTAKLFEEMCRKLLYMQADGETVLMKNPWDTSAGVEISALFPESRFIFISRDPIRILNSQVKNAEVFASGDSLYLDLLVRGFPLAQLAFFIELNAVKKSDNSSILPIFWSDNYVSLAPGESKTLNLKFYAKDLGDNLPGIIIQGMNYGDNKKPLNEIDLDSLKKAIEVAKYFMSQAKKVYSRLN